MEGCCINNNDNHITLFFLPHCTFTFNLHKTDAIGVTHWKYVRFTWEEHSDASTVTIDNDSHMHLP